MQHAQQAQFMDRINRIQAGGPNTCSTIYCGFQDVDTPRGKTVSGVTQVKPLAEGQMTTLALLAEGVKSAILKLVGLGFALLLLYYFAGL